MDNRNLAINGFIDNLRAEVEANGLAYNKEKDRWFANHILNAREFGEFAEKIGQTREEFAINVFKASWMIKYRKGVCTGPMSIYKNYPEVYNETAKRSAKQKEKEENNFISIPVIGTI